jgi:hypothetical protein
MKTISSLLFVVVMVSLTACATKVKFPVSSVTPAANMYAIKGTDNQKNYTLKIVAENLASAERISSSGNNYSVWIVTKNQGVKNVGQIDAQNAKKNVFNTTTAFDFNEVFITVENQSNLNYPQGKEIGRIRI